MDIERNILIQNLRHAEEEYRKIYSKLNPYASYFVCEGQKGLVAIRDAILYLSKEEENN